MRAGHHLNIHNCWCFPISVFFMLFFLSFMSVLMTLWGLLPILSLSESMNPSLFCSSVCLTVPEPQHQHFALAVCTHVHLHAWLGIRSRYLSEDLCSFCLFVKELVVHSNVVITHSRCLCYLGTAKQFSYHHRYVFASV